ncbi:DUF4286 family protein [Rhizosphaericola mali]|uniref:DUF4286 family protein n=1 Tax=Rhizosphaericola mali TaxID=2545455 RepID=A0A5P2G082_9BACT|nr:DUF4286 family protein [Rhizosphaericola mali]QES87529.1 DUF4286 family protein [Rhizosphaericola mali]
MENAVLFIHNETLKIDWQIHDSWKDWILEKRIPILKKIEGVTEVRLLKLVGLDETDGPTYALQLGFYAKSDYNRYIELERNNLNGIASALWGDLVLGFETTMENVLI